MDIEQRIRSLSEDSTSGAAELLRACVKLFADVCGSPEVSDQDFPEVSRRVAQGVMAARPAMAGFVNLAAAVVEVLEQAGPQDDVRSETLKALSRFSKIRTSAIARVAQLTLELLKPEVRVLTISRSSTVLAALSHASEAGLRLRVICPESRPMCEGVTLAGELVALRHRPAVVCDGLAPFLVEGAGVVLVGGDTVMRRGLVNKAGTYGLALAARPAGVPMYALCPTEKFLAPAYEHYFHNPARDPTQILAESRPGMDVWNFYFDITPLELLTGVITEDGILSPDEALQRLGSMPVVEWLARGEAE